MWCFVQGTLILTDSGEKKIENIRVGDKLIGYDNKPVDVEVTSIEDSVADSYYSVNVGNKVIKATGEHPFYNGAGYEPIKQFNAGDTLYQFGNKLRETEINAMPLITDAEAKVYSLSVSFPHNYFAENILVHNKTRVMPPGQPRDPEREQDFKDSREAIEAAHQAGIMGDEEYHQRMTEGREGIEAQFQDLMRRTTERGHGRVNIGALRGELRDMEMGRIGELARDRRAIDIERAERAWEPARWKAGALPRLFEQFPRWPEEGQPRQPAPERERPRIQPWLEREEQRRQEKERRSQWRKEFVRQMQERSSSLTPLEKKAIQRHYGFPIFRTRPRKPRSRFSDGLRGRPRTYLRRIRITPGPGSIRRREKVERIREQIRRRQERNLRRR